MRVGDGGLGIDSERGASRTASPRGSSRAGPEPSPRANTLITIRPVPHDGQLLPAGLSGQITGEGDWPGSFRILLDNGQGTSDDTEIELTSDYFITTRKANAAGP